MFKKIRSKVSKFTINFDSWSHEQYRVYFISLTMLFILAIRLLHVCNIVLSILHATVTVYKCSELGRDCSRCVSLPSNVTTAKFNCEWCSTNVCSYNQTCQQAADKCDPPSIIKVYYKKKFSMCFYIPAMH